MKYIYLIIGFIFLGIGIAGIYLPILPATPFLLIATACFAKGSKRFHNWFISSKIYKDNIEPVKNRKGLSIKKKVKILALITISISLSIYLVKIPHVRILLLIILIFHYIYFLTRIKTIED